MDRHKAADAFIRRRGGVKLGPELASLRRSGSAHIDRKVTRRVILEFVALLPAFLFVALNGFHGIPGLRHDWAWIPNRADFISSALATLAWRPDGIGGPRPYPTDYLLALLDATIVAVVGVHTLFPIFLFGTALLCVHGARSIAAALDAAPSARFGVSLFALYNPWVYTEFVAGHLGMIIAYGATMAFLGRALRSRQSNFSLALLVCISAAQLQFFLALIVASAFIAATRRRVLPLVTGLIVAMPTLVGILGNRSALAAIPNNLAWQSVQSLRPTEAAALTGYFANYVVGFSPLAFDAVWSMLALSAIGGVVARRRKVAALVFALGTCAWLWSTGVRGPIAAMYSAAVVNVPALAIFRELYDLLAYVAIAYVALASMAAASNKALAIASILPGIILAGTWWLAPPLRLLVSLQDLPPVSVSAPEHTRVAFFPDVQPLTFAGRGSGLDPNAYPRPSDVMPLNGLDASFPANVALRRFALQGDVVAIEALGVSRLISRPWLTTDVRTASAAFAFGGAHASRRQSGTIILSPVPELVMFSELRIGKLPPPIGSDTIFFGDASGVVGPSVPVAWQSFERPTIFTPLRNAFRAKDAWVDVRLAYVARPEFGQGLGGVVTTSKVAYLALEGGRSALVWIEGRLLDAEGHVISRNTNGYRWIAIGRRVEGVRCDGTCVVVAQGSVPERLPALDRSVAPRTVAFFTIAPWFGVARLPSNASAALLRYAVAYDPNWIGVTSSGALAHVRVESAFNGWIVPPHRGLRSIVFFERIALAQSVFEALAVLWTLWLCYVYMRFRIMRLRLLRAT